MNYIIECEQGHKFRFDSSKYWECPKCGSRLKIENVKLFPGKRFTFYPSLEEEINKKRKAHEPSIKVTINSISEPPTVEIDGLKAPIVECEYTYKTRDSDSDGVHKYSIKYIDDSSNTVKVIGYERLMWIKKKGD